MLKHAAQTLNLRIGEDEASGVTVKDAPGRIHHIHIQSDPLVPIPPIPRPSLRPKSIPEHHKENGGRADGLLGRRPGGAPPGILKSKGVRMGGHSNPAPTLPVSMEDTDLFPKNKFGINDHPSLEPGVVLEMKAGLNRVWWSRLITATRGYVLHAFKHDDELVFLFDDAFIFLHSALVESGDAAAVELLGDLETLEADGCEALQSLEHGVAVSEADNPFFDPKTSQTYRRLFGGPGPGAYGRAFKMGFVFLVFFNVLGRVGGRWVEKKRKPKGIQFAEDPEWHPDARVVLFQELGNGSRAWVICDYDRHLLAYWRPHGVSVIFGDRYIQCKKEEGFRLCAHCGLLESALAEFRITGPRAQSGFTCFCSDGCYQLYSEEQRNAS